MRPFSDVAGQTAGSAQLVNGNPLAQPKKPRGKRNGPLAPFKVERTDSLVYPWIIVRRADGTVFDFAPSRSKARRLAKVFAQEQKLALEPVQEGAFGGATAHRGPAY